VYETTRLHLKYGNNSKVIERDLWDNITYGLEHSLTQNPVTSKPKGLNFKFQVSRASRNVLYKS